MGKYVRQVNVKLSPELDEDLKEISEFLGLKLSELLRSWASDKILELRSTKQFQKWKESHAPGG